jgi:hypothetical protein
VLGSSSVELNEVLYGIFGDVESKHTVFGAVFLEDLTH